MERQCNFPPATDMMINDEEQRVDDITYRLANVEMANVDFIPSSNNNLQAHHNGYLNSNDIQYSNYSDNDKSTNDFMMDIENASPGQRIYDESTLFTNYNQYIGTDKPDTKSNMDNSSTILIVTNIDPATFTDGCMQAQFESLFRVYDSNIIFRYLKSFKRVRLDFSDPSRAVMARDNLNRTKFGCTEFKCFNAQMIKPSLGGTDNGSVDAGGFLKIPKPTKQFLISPPASPPVGWEPVTESEPCIDVQLISAIANLVPGKVHEIHPASESQPGIFVEVCEDNNQDPQMRGHPRIPRTSIPTTVSH